MLTMSSEKEEEEVYCDCSDEEMYNPCNLKKGTWEPKTEDMIRIFDELKSKKVLEISWTCPGRRPPESESAEEEVKEEVAKTPPKEEEKKPLAPTEFDFDDEFTETKAVLTPRRTPGSAPKSEKKVARMDKVLKDMMMQRKLQAAERESRKLAKSPRNNASPGRARIGSPAGSPRAAVNMNRQSPVRAPAPEGFPTTPLRAPVEFENLSRNSASETVTSNGFMPRAMDTSSAGPTVTNPMYTSSPGSNRASTPSAVSRPGTPGGSVRTNFPGNSSVPNTLTQTGRPNTPGAAGRPNTPGNSGRPSTPGSGRSITPSNSGRSTPSSTGRLTPSRPSQTVNMAHPREVIPSTFGDLVSLTPSGVIPHVQVSASAGSQTLTSAPSLDGQSKMDTS